jgi:hypothetical protein
MSHAIECRPNPNELGDVHPELDDLGLGEVLPEPFGGRVIDGVVVGGQEVGEVQGSALGLVRSAASSGRSS